ncbi:hypothetical protein J7L85_05175 [candidate division WOR-3 bacterium]|nr:hypothetical protein [candidate division WOR-3 bacterium]
MKGLSDGSFFRLSEERKEDVLTKGKNPYRIAMLMEFLYRFSRVTQPRIGQMTGDVNYSSASQAIRRFRKRLVKDRESKKIFEKLKRELDDLSRLKTWPPYFAQNLQFKT